MNRIVLGSLLLASVATQNASAQQAWVGEPNSLSASLDYSYSRSDEIRGLEEGPFNLSIVSQTAALGVEYTPSEKLGLTATVPVVCPRVDGGDTDCALQDFRLDVRYMLLDGVVTVSPHLSASVPMSD